jgi:phosphohistidine swiveling domain-containing protein
MRHLDEPGESPNDSRYFELEDKLRKERDKLYPGTPLGQVQWAIWDSLRTPGQHQDHSPFRVKDPTPFKDVEWSGQTAVERAQKQRFKPAPVSPMQMGLQMAKKGMRGYHDYNPDEKFRIFVHDVFRAAGIQMGSEFDKDNPARYTQEEYAEIYNYLLEQTKGAIPERVKGAWGDKKNPKYFDLVDQYGAELAKTQLGQENLIPNKDVRQQYTDDNYNGVRSLSGWSRPIPTWHRVPQWATPWRPMRFSAEGYTIYGRTVGGIGTAVAVGTAIRPDIQSREEIESFLASLPTHREDYLKQREQIPEWAINRGGKVGAGFETSPEGTGVTYAPGVIIVSPYVDVNDNWILYHPSCYGIVAQMGGANSHGVVVARERNIPIVVNADISTIKYGDQLRVNSGRGTIDVNGGGVGEEEHTPQEAEEPTVAWVWSSAGSDTVPIPPGAGGAVSLHYPMMMQLEQQGRWDESDFAVGVIYDDGKTEEFMKQGPNAGLQEFLDGITPRPSHSH